MRIARGWEKRVIRTKITYAKRTVRIFSVSPQVSLSVFSLVPDLLFDCSRLAYLNTQKYGLFCSLNNYLHSFCFQATHPWDFNLYVLVQYFDSFSIIFTDVFRSGGILSRDNQQALLQLLVLTMISGLLDFISLPAWTGKSQMVHVSFWFSVSVFGVCSYHLSVTLIFILFTDIPVDVRGSFIVPVYVIGLC